MQKKCWNGSRRCLELQIPAMLAKLTDRVDRVEKLNNSWSRHNLFLNIGKLQKLQDLLVPWWELSRHGSDSIHWLKPKNWGQAQYLLLVHYLMILVCSCILFAFCNILSLKVSHITRLHLVTLACFAFRSLRRARTSCRWIWPMRSKTTRSRPFQFSWLLWSEACYFSPIWT